MDQVRRVVTGHDDRGRAVVLHDGAPPRVIRPAHQPGLAFWEIWNTRGTPAPIAAQEDEPTTLHNGTAPPPNGTVIRIVDIPPEGPNGPDLGPDAAALLAQVGLAHHGAHLRHPLMHRTQSVDYGVVLQGEIVLLLDDQDITLRAGDVVVQRGTIHAWTNRTGQVARMLFVLTDGRFAPDLAAQLQENV